MTFDLGKMAALANSFRMGQQWQYKLDGEWIDMPNKLEPGWFYDTEYRLKPETPSNDQL